MAYTSSVVKLCMVSNAFVFDLFFHRIWGWIVLRSTCKRIFLQPVKLYIDLFAVKLIYCILIMTQIKNQTNSKSRACCDNQSMLWFPSARFLRFYWYIGWLRCNISNNFVQVINQYLIILKRLLLLFSPSSCIAF